MRQDDRQTGVNSAGRRDEQRDIAKDQDDDKQKKCPHGTDTRGEKSKEIDLLSHCSLETIVWADVPDCSATSVKQAIGRTLTLRTAAMFAATNAIATYRREPLS